LIELTKLLLALSWGIESYDAFGRFAACGFVDLVLFFLLWLLSVVDGD
jgi:hypothetical protein